MKLYNSLIARLHNCSKVITVMIKTGFRLISQNKSKWITKLSKIYKCDDC